MESERERERSYKERERERESASDVHTHILRVPNKYGKVNQQKYKTQYGVNTTRTKYVVGPSLNT